MKDEEHPQKEGTRALAPSGEEGKGERVLAEGRVAGTQGMRVSEGNQTPGERDTRILKP